MFEPCLYAHHSEKISPFLISSFFKQKKGIRVLCQSQTSSLVEQAFLNNFFLVPHRDESVRCTLHAL